MNHKPYGFYEKFFKRFFDCFFSICAITILSPIFGIIVLLVRVNLGSPVIFVQERLGKDEKIFKLFKFRSMNTAKDEYGKLLPDGKRLTRFGKILRSTSLDELPELLNIVKGDMSIVGPRPLLAEYQSYYTEKEHHRHDVRPGLSGLAQVNGRNNNSWESIFDWDLKYVNKITFLGDVKIILNTVWKVFKRSDIQSGSQNFEGRLDVERSKN
ncbi:MAG: sugar transferase [Lachnospiraceae bacterium]|nr:sugar transferase [Lachnospiraceae bacterium]